MSSLNTIGIMIAILFTFIGFIIFSKPIKSLLKFFLRSGLGLGGIVLVNFILSPLEIFIGLNYLTAFIIGILGLPGFISLYILKILL